MPPCLKSVGFAMVLVGATANTPTLVLTANLPLTSRADSLEEGKQRREVMFESAPRFGDRSMSGFAK
jgi:hypothetical protein